MFSSICKSFGLIREYIEKYKDIINLKSLKDIAKFNKIFAQWYIDNKIAIEDCAQSLLFPSIEDSIEYQRNILSSDEDG